jgi:hypothetical protein
MSMLTVCAETDPDEIERGIIAAARSLPEQAWTDFTTWTKRFNFKLAEIAKAQGFQRYAHHLEIVPGDDDQAGEWLYDMTWLNKITGEIELALESEWHAAGSNDSIDHDFTKLLSIKARHRAFVFFDAAVDAQLTRLIKQVCDFPQTQGGDRFLLIGVDRADHVTHKLIVASGPSYKELRKAHEVRSQDGFVD